MAGMSAMMLCRLMFRPILHSQNFDHFFRTNLAAAGFCGPDWSPSMTHVRCAATKSVVDEKKSSAPLAEVQRLLYQAEERYKSAGGGVEPIPKITLDHVTIGYARSGGPGGQNVNKVNTKVDMRFNVKNAHWLNERVRERIMQMEKGRINKDGEIVFSSSKTRTQQGNAEDALAKLQVFTYQKRKLQAIIDAASYVPPPPSEETTKKIAKFRSADIYCLCVKENTTPGFWGKGWSALGEQKRLDKRKAQSQQKALRRS